MVKLCITLCKNAHVVHFFITIKTINSIEYHRHKYYFTNRSYNSTSIKTHTANLYTIPQV